AVLLGVFFVLPIALTAYRSLFSWDLLTPPELVGLSNYRLLWEKGQLSHTLSITLGYSALVVAGSMSLGLALALALNRPGTWAAVVRSAVFSSYVVSWVAVALLWLWVLDPDLGLLSRSLRSLSLPTASWLG